MVSKQAAGRLRASTTVLGDLGPELLSAIFCKLGPSLMHLAAVSCVCKTWRGVVQEDVWRKLCLEAAPTLCESMGWCKQSIPPGGWLSVYKLLLYCPGLHRSSYTPVALNNEYNDTFDRGWWELIGHVQEWASGFQTGLLVTRDLRRREPFQKDVLFVSRLCKHERGLRAQSCACRGFVGDFARSAIAKKSGAIAYLQADPQEQQKMQEEAENLCSYCQAPLFELLEKSFFSNNFLLDRDILDEMSSDPEDIQRTLQGFDISGDVCGNGHLVLEVYRNWERVPFLDKKSVTGSGEELHVQISGLLDGVCEAFYPVVEEDGAELLFRKSLDAFSVAKKLRGMAYMIEALDLLDKKEGEQKGISQSPGGEAEAGSLKTQSQLELDLHLQNLKQEICKIAETFEADEGEDSAMELESDVEMGDDVPF
jgi:hypothetical protein